MKDKFNDKFDNKIFQMAQQEQILLPEMLAAKIDAGLNSLAECHPRKKVMNFRRSLILAAVLVMLFSITAVAAGEALKQRMEAMNREKLEEYFVQIYTSRLSSDNYNRPYTDSEKKRMEELRSSYEEQGNFPEGELTMIEDAKAYKGKNVSFLKNTSTFFFPEKEMNDEQLLQIIDFQAKRDYSLQKMNEMIADGQAEFPKEAVVSVSDEPTDTSILQSDAVLNPEQELTIPYKGNLSISSMAAGNNCIFLGGRNASIHRMEIGSSDSSLFFEDDDENTIVTALCQDSEGNVYAGLQRKLDDGSFDACIRVLDRDGNFLREINLASYERKDGITINGEKSGGYIRRMMVDDNYLYLRGLGFPGADFLLILDKEGKLVSKMASERKYSATLIYGMCIGKDKKPYTVFADENHGLGIASINPEEGVLDKIYPQIVPEDTISIDLLFPGYNADFVMWGYSGSFSFNTKENAAALIMPAYEFPCPTEGALYLGLPDGRTVLAYSTEYREYTSADGCVWHDRVPEKTSFYYLTES